MKEANLVPYRDMGRNVGLPVACVTAYTIHEGELLNSRTPSVMAWKRTPANQWSRPNSR